MTMRHKGPPLPTNRNPLLIRQTSPTTATNNNNTNIVPGTPSAGNIVVGFQELAREDQTIVIGRVKIPLPTEGRAFLLRRYDVHAISLTHMFKCAFPEATEEEQRLEADWVKKAYKCDLQHAKGHKLVKLAGFWVPMDVAAELSQDYGIAAHLGPLLSADHPTLAPKPVYGSRAFHVPSLTSTPLKASRRSERAFSPAAEDKASAASMGSPRRSSSRTLEHSSDEAEQSQNKSSSKLTRTRSRTSTTTQGDASSVNSSPQRGSKSNTAAATPLTAPKAKRARRQSSVEPFESSATPSSLASASRATRSTIKAASSAVGTAAQTVLKPVEEELAADLAETKRLYAQAKKTIADQARAMAGRSNDDDVEMLDETAVTIPSRRTKRQHVEEDSDEDQQQSGAKKMPQTLRIRERGEIEARQNRPVIQRPAVRAVVGVLAMGVGFALTNLLPRFL